MSAARLEMPSWLTACVMQSQVIHINYKICNQVNCKASFRLLQGPRRPVAVRGIAIGALRILWKQVLFLTLGIHDELLQLLGSSFVRAPQWVRQYAVDALREKASDELPIDRLSIAY